MMNAVSNPATKLTDCRILNVYREGKTLKVDVYADEGVTTNAYGEPEEIINIFSTFTVDCADEAVARMYEITVREWADADTALQGEIYPEIEGLRLTDLATGRSVETTDLP